MSTWLTGVRRRTGEGFVDEQMDGDENGDGDGKMEVDSRGKWGKRGTPKVHLTCN